MPDDELIALRSAVDRFVRRTARWSPARWALPGTDVGSRSDVASRTEVVAELVQRLADLAADAEGVRHRSVPRSGGPTALPDKLRVIAADLSRSGDSVRIAEATEYVENAKDRT